MTSSISALSSPSCAPKPSSRGSIASMGKNRVTRAATSSVSPLPLREVGALGSALCAVRAQARRRARGFMLSIDRNPSPRPSPYGLRRAHISEFPTLSHLFEAMPASAHGDRTRWALGSVTGPATEARNNPGEPADRPLGMWIFLLGCFAFETGLQGLEHRQLFRRHHVGGRAIDGAVAGEDR